MATEPILIPDATAEPAKYKQALLDLTGEADPLEIFEGTVAQWRELTRDLTPAQLAAAPSDGEWSVSAR